MLKNACSIFFEFVLELCALNILMLLYVFVWMTFAAINIYIFDVTPVQFLKFQNY